MDHDRLFKDLLTTFFVEFLELFFPQVAAELDRGRIEFLDKEIFADLDTGDRHEVDLLAKVRLHGQETFILIHIENQSTWQADFPRRMFRYFSLLHAKFNLPVFPIALFSYDRPLTPAADRFEMNLFGQSVLQFQFQTIQLNRLNWRDFLRQPNPVASALMAKMEIAVEDRPRVKLECLRMMATLKLDPARQITIGVFMRAYLQLTNAEETVYNQLPDATELAKKEQAMHYITEWHAKARAEILLKMLTRRFGDLPVELRNRLHEITDESIDELADAIFDFKSLDDAQAFILKSPVNQWPQN